MMTLDLTEMAPPPMVEAKTRHFFLLEHLAFGLFSEPILPFGIRIATVTLPWASAVESAE